MRATMAAGPRQGLEAVALGAREGLATALWRRPECGRPLHGTRPLDLLLRAAYLIFCAWALLVTTANVQWAIAVHPDAPVWRLLGWLPVVLLAVGLLLAQRRPVLGWRIVAGQLALGLIVLPWEFLTHPPDLLCPLLAAVLALVGLAAPGRVAAATAVLTTALLAVAGVSVAAIVGTLVPVVVAATVASRQRARRALTAEQAAGEAARAERAVLAERARIAREMHDVVAHHMSLIAVRCETAPYRLGELPGPARTELSEVGSAARQALTEMQALLGVLRQDDQPVEHAPQPGLADLDALLQDARAAGAPVAWSIEVPREAVPGAVGLTVYRVVQQALANAGQHAPGAEVAVTVTAEGGDLRVEIRNGPGSRPGSPGAGHGLVGMRERLDLHRGTLHAGPTSDGGFAVRAHLPGVPL
jgi:signal transduction histidine kinase